jgi:galactokinase
MLATVSGGWRYDDEILVAVHDREQITTRAPGRVNLIGDHTDYTGGLCFPMAIDRAVVVTGHRHPTSGIVNLTSEGQPDAVIPLDVDVDDVRAIEPEWARYVAGVIHELRPTSGFIGTVRSDLPAGSGLSSSAALEVACALALGGDSDDPIGLARLCQAAEHTARGVPTGLLDQVASICGVEGCGLRLDCRSLEVTPVALPPDDVAQWLVVWAGARSLAASNYGRRVAELAAAEGEIGPLRDAEYSDLESIVDPTIRARSRHVLSENSRVDDFVEAIGSGDLVTAGALMSASHHSLSGDFDCSTPRIDALCRDLSALAGVFGARITGGGWGGCVVALTEPSAVDPGAFEAAWYLRPSGGATVGHGA